jgi:hypothetical protein
MSADPDGIHKMGTKEMLYSTRAMSWGCDTALYANRRGDARRITARLA